jgi:hypothetical protein
MVGRKLEHKTVRLGHVHVVVGELNFDKKMHQMGWLRGAMGYWATCLMHCGLGNGL